MNIEDQPNPLDSDQNRALETNNTDNPTPNQGSVQTPQMSQKKKSSKKLILISLLIILGAVGTWYGYKLVNPQIAGPRIHPLTLIPANALYILETDHPYRVWEEMSDTRVWEVLEKDQEYQEYGKMLREIEEALSSFNQAIDLIGNRKVYISSHPFRTSKTDYLYIIDLEGFGVVRTWMTSLENVSKREFNGTVIYQQVDIESKETMHFAFEDNYLIASYTHTLVEISLQEKEKATLSRSFDFIDISNKILGEGLVRIYVNYNAIYDYLSASNDKESIENVKSNLPLKYSGLYFDIEQESFLLEGYSNYSDSLFTYLKLFPAAGNGNLDISTILPEKTSIYLSFGFSSFKKFYKSLVTQLSEDPESGEDYQSYVSRTEKFLDINLEEDLASWIGDEIALVQIEVDNQSETALILKAKNKKVAIEGISFLSQQIKRKTPVRFKAVTYREHTINFMAVKGFFNLIFGKLFDNYDRPYYTVIDEYVIFSGHPNVLRMMIDNYKNNLTLAGVPSFKKIIKDIGEEHSAMIYLQFELLEQSKSALIGNDVISLLKSKKGFINHFPQLAIKILPVDDMFKTKLSLSIKSESDDSSVENVMPIPDQEINYDSVWQINPGEQIVISEIEIEDLTAKKQTEEYEDGIPKYEVAIKNGLKHGNYFEYYDTGELKIKGKYKNDLKEGVWKFYNKDGKLDKKEKYKKDVLI